MNIYQFTLFPLVLFLAYLMGSVPFGAIAGWMWGVDLRKQGSGNIGATNVLRVIGPLPAFFVLVLDLLKGTAAAALALYLFGDPLLIILAGLAAVLGHMFSIFLEFQGGRGVATAAGVLLGIAPVLFLIVFLWALLIIIFTRYVSLASITGALLLVILMLVFNKPWPYALVSGAIAALILIKHIPNLKRLLAGTEPQIGMKA